MTDMMRSQFETALREADPHTSLHALADSLKSRGLSQVEMYHLFVEYLRKTDANDPRYDAIADTLDLIWRGPRAKGRALFDTKLTDEDVQDSSN